MSFNIMQEKSAAVSAPYCVALAAPERPGMAAGSGSTAVVLFHGITGLPAEVFGLASVFHQRGFAVFAPCLSGHGTSIEQLRQVSHRVWLHEAEALFEHIAQSSYSRIIVGGLSFGGLLALHLAATFPEKVSAGILLAIPLQFRSNVRELTLQFLSYMPDALLDMLPTVPKVKRAAGIFSSDRIAYNRHSIAAAARIVRIRRDVLSEVHRIRCPLLLLQDPEDHHLAEGAGNLLRVRCSAPVSARWIPGGQHELTIGAEREKVEEEILHFINGVLQEMPDAA